MYRLESKLILSSLIALSASANAQLTTTRIAPSKDAAVSQFEPTARLGLGPVLYTRHHFSFSNSTNWEHRSHLDFPLQGIPQNATIVSATVTIQFKASISARPCQGNVVAAYEVKSSSWNEATIDWNTAPSVEANALSSAKIPAAPGPMTWDVTQLLRQRVAASQSALGLAIRDTTQSAPGFNVPFAEYHARESTNTSVRPHLDVAYYPNSALKASTTTLSATLGGNVFFRLCPSAAHAGELYILLGSLSGTSPGLPIRGLGVMPVTPDAFMNWTLAQANTPNMVSSIGTLDAYGNGLSQFVTPGPIPGLKDATFTFAAITFSAGAPSLLTNPVQVLVQ